MCEGNKFPLEACIKFPALATLKVCEGNLIVNQNIVENGNVVMLYSRLARPVEL
jgi:hypothetical protein